MIPLFHRNFKRFIFEAKTKILRSKIYDSYYLARKDLFSNDVNTLNFERRTQLVAYAYKHIPFYKKKYMGITGVADIRSEEDFLQLPTVTRDDLANNFEEFVAEEVSPNQYEKVTSSGSTGRPVSVLQDPDFPYTTLQWRILDWWGVKPYENQAFIYRYRRPKMKRLGNIFLWWPTRRAFMAGSEMNLENAKKFADKINRIKPALLQGYVDVVYEFALFLLDNDIKIHPPKMVWVTSAPLFENQRQIMAKAFGAPVCDQYGNTEVFTIAAECPKQHGLHIMHDAVHVEVVDANNRPLPAGESGKIVVTDLRNKVFPLIRYETGDRGKLLDYVCECGIPLPLMDNVRGRQSVTLKTPSSLAIRSEHLALMFEKHMKCIRQIQLVQKADYSVNFCYVVDAEGDEDAIANEVELIMQDLKTKVRGEIQINAVRVNDIQRKGNKKPLLVSHVS